MEGSAATAGRPADSGPMPKLPSLSKLSWLSSLSSLSLPIGPLPCAIALAAGPRRTSIR
jgi:hypothetical protein